MAQTVANLAGVLKDAWTAERCIKQFLDLNPVMDWFMSAHRTMIGAQAQVPLHSARSGPSTSTSAAGGVLNRAGQQEVDQALYTMVYLWKQIALETGALVQAAGGDMSIVDAKDFEIQGAISDMSKDASRMLANNGDGLIAQCTTGGASTTVNLLPAVSGGLGYDAIVRKWLRGDMLVDIGTTGDSDVIVGGATISAVVKSATAPQIVIDSSVTTSSSHYVSITNPNSATAPNPELSGLRNLFGSATSIVGGINPATAGNEYWAPALVDSSTTSLSIDLLLALELAAWQESDNSEMPTWLFSGKQFNAFYSILQNQVRFAGENGMGAGGMKGLKGLTFSGVGINAWQEIADKEIYRVPKSSIERIKGNVDKPTWTSELRGAGRDMLDWSPSTTAFVEGLVFPVGVGVNQRNNSAAATNLVS